MTTASHSMLFGFQYVDPIAGEFPPVTAQEAGLIPARMRRLLARRSHAELDKLIFLVNLLIEASAKETFGSDRHLVLLSRFDNGELTVAEASELEEFSEVIGSEVRLLLRSMGQKTLEDESWAHLFAAFALALLNEAAEAEQHYGSWLDEDEGLHDWRVLVNVTSWTMMAQEAATLAEALEWGMPETRQREAPLQDTNKVFREQLSAQNQRAAFHRHAPTQRAILALTEFYLKGQFESYRAAALTFCEANPDAVRHLAPTNRLRTLTEGLSGQLRGKRLAD